MFHDSQESYAFYNAWWLRRDSISKISKGVISVGAEPGQNLEKKMHNLRCVFFWSAGRKKNRLFSANFGIEKIKSVIFTLKSYSPFHGNWNTLIEITGMQTIFILVRYIALGLQIERTSHHACRQRYSYRKACLPHTKRRWFSWQLRGSYRNACFPYTKRRCFSGKTERPL
jgi:hypothetical protein